MKINAKNQIGVTHTHYSYEDVKSGKWISIPDGKKDAFYFGVSNLRDVKGDGVITHRGVLKVCPQGTNGDDYLDDLEKNAAHSLLTFEYNDFSTPSGVADESIKCRNNVCVDANFFAENIGIDGGEADTYSIGSSEAFYSTVYSKWLVGSGSHLIFAPGNNVKNGSIKMIDGYLYPNTPGGYSLGTSNNPFYMLYSTYGVKQVSDKRDKIDIQYLSEGNLTDQDCSKFVKDELKLATYKMKDSRDVNDTQIGFIAQDIIDTKLGSLIVEKGEKEEDRLTYSLSNYVNVLAGALKESLNKIDTLEKRLEKLEK